MATIFEKTCRTCMAENVELIPIWDEHEEHEAENSTMSYHSMQQSIETMLKEFTVLNIAADDELPRNICRMCLEDLKKAFLFKQNCVRSEIELRKYLNRWQADEVNGIRTVCHVILDKSNEMPSQLICEEVPHEMNEIEQIRVKEERDSSSFLIDSQTLTYSVEYTRRNSCEENSRESFDFETILKIESEKYHCENDSCAGNDNYDKDQGRSTDNKLIDRNISFNNDTFWEETEEHSPIDQLSPLIKTESSPFLFKCNQCAAEFTQQSSYEQHFKFQCTLSNVALVDYAEKLEDFTAKDFVSRHENGTAANSELSTSEGLKIRCSYCKATFATQRSLNVHINKKHIFNKSHLNVSKSNDKCLEERNNLNVKKTQRWFTCVVCDKNCIKKTDVHSINNLQMNSFQCKKCSSSPTQKTDLKRTFFVCDLCGKGFENKYNLKAHLMIHAQFKPFKCNFCTSSFLTKYNLEYHIGRHTNDRPFQCYICKKCFKRKRDLMNHLKVHNQSNKFECKNCSITFDTRFELNRHAIFHLKELPFLCSFCESGFAKKVSLTAHIKRHFQPKSLHCNICSSSFQFRFDLENHIRSHTNVRPFICKICGNSYKYSSNLIAHRHSVHRGEKYPGSGLESSQQFANVCETTTLAAQRTL